MKKIIYITLILVFPIVLLGQWGPDVRLTNDPGTSFLLYNNARSIATYGNNIHVIWRDTRDGNYEVYYKRSLDNGTTWGPDTRITNDPAYSKNPCIAVSDSNIHMIWTDTRDGTYDEVYYKNSLDNGNTWSSDTRLTTSACNSLYPSLAVSDSILHVVWYEDRVGSGNYEVYYRRSFDNGITWKPETSLTNAAGWSGIPSVAVSGSNVHVVWRDGRDGDNEIYYKRSLDNGITWSADTNLTNNVSSSQDVCVTVSGSNIHVAWQDNRDGNTEIYYKRSLDNGATWGADTRLTNATNSSMRPSPVAYGSTVHLIWWENRDSNYEIYYKNSLDNGTTWSADTNLTNNPLYQGMPSSAISGSDVHVVWMDERDGNDEIYYKRYLGTIPNFDTIFATAYGNGTITPSGTVLVPEGDDTTFTITPDLGHHLDSLLVDGVNHGADSTSFTFESVTENHTIDVYFSINTYTIEATATTGGTIIPSGSIMVEYGADTTFTISANADYVLDSVLVDGISQGAIPSYTFTAVDDDHTIHAMFSAIALPGWSVKESLPAAGDVKPGKYVKDGGAMTVTSVSDQGDEIYAFYGNKSKQFYKYSQSTWSALESIPYGYKSTDPLKINKKTPKKGSALCWDNDNTVFATKGNTNEFWAYYIDADTWVQKAFVPVPKKYKGGTSIAFWDGKVYLLAGNQKVTDPTNFYSYTPSADTAGGEPWTSLTGAPLTPNNKKWKDGSAITANSGMVYALKGGDKYNVFCAYVISLGIWAEIESMPLTHPMIGKKVKVKDGGAIATDGLNIYAIKGGGKQDFWIYTPVTDAGAWTPLETIPRLWKKSVPKTGAALAYAEGEVWLMKGNNSLEYWRYLPSEMSKVKTQKSKVSQIVIASESEAISDIIPTFNVTPNPFTSLTTIRYSVPISGKVSIKLYNTDGRLVETLANTYLNAGTYTMNLSSNTLAKGVYFLRYEANNNQTEIKLIIQ